MANGIGNFNTTERYDLIAVLNGITWHISPGWNKVECIMCDGIKDERAPRHGHKENCLMYSLIRQLEGG